MRIRLIQFLVIEKTKEETKNEYGTVQQGTFLQSGNVSGWLPHCKAESASMAGGDHTIPVNMVQSEPADRTTPMNQTQSILSDDDKTVKVDINTESGEEFAVGWLICIKGNHVGHDFRLHSGRNFIGRGHDMDVRLDGDTSVSRASQAVVVYDPKSRSYLAQPGESRELFYVNGEVSLESKLLKAYDQLEIGNTTPSGSCRFAMTSLTGAR